MPPNFVSVNEQAEDQILANLQFTALMSDLHLNLSRLGLAQYVDRFSEEGFETWETVLDITESDLYECTIYLKVPG